MPYYDITLYTSQYRLNETSTCKYYLVGKKNQHGEKQNYIETPVTN